MNFVITEHAFERAQERLGMSATAFQQWVASTSPHWMEVSPTYLWRFSVQVSAKDARHFVCPWTPTVWVAMVVSYDGAIRTVMDYTQTKPTTTEAIVMGEVLQKMVQNGVVAGDAVLRKFTGINPAGPHTEAALQAYAADTLTLADLQAFFKLNHGQRALWLSEAGVSV